MVVSQVELHGHLSSRKGWINFFMNQGISKKDAEWAFRELVAGGWLRRTIIRVYGRRFTRYYPVYPETGRGFRICTRVKVKILDYIGVEAETGEDLYYDVLTNEYVLIERDTGKEIMRSDSIEIDETISIDTEQGHDVPFVAEVTARTRVSGMSRKDLDRFESEFQTRLEDYFKSKPGFDQIKSAAQKEGVEYKITPEAPEYPRASVRIEKSQPRKKAYPEEEVDLETIVKEKKEEKK